MCGIAGVIALRTPLEKAQYLTVVESMIDDLQHRGPDSRGVVASDLICLGACRLAILDLTSESNQPLRSHVSGCTLAFNGEIFNYVEVKDELMKLGHEFTSHGDTEVILRAYEEWGLGCFEHLNGMFAVAIHDESKRRIVLARDRFGIKPLYFAKCVDSIVFASEAIAILRSGLVPAELDPVAISDYLRYGITDHDARTFFARVQQLPPGTFCLIEQGGVSVRAWYPNKKNPLGCTEETLSGFDLEMVRTLLGESVRLRMRSDVPVGILLSGGLDSSALLGLAAPLAGSLSLECFHVSFPDHEIDETDFAKLASVASGVPLIVEDASFVTTETISRCIADQGEPVISPSVVAQWLIMQAIHRRGIRVAISGQGADELLGGYDYFESYALADLLRDFDISGLVRHGLQEGNRERLPSLLVGMLFALLPARAKLRAWRKRWLRCGQGTPSEYALELVGCRTFKDLVMFHLARRLPELLRYEDRNSMAFSIETRHPFLDHLVVESVLRLSNRSMIGNGARKEVLRKVAQGIVPQQILERRTKLGFQTPDSWLRTDEFTESFRRFVRSAPPVLAELMDLQEVESMLGKPSVTPGTVKDLWRVYNLLAWYELVVRPISKDGEVCDGPGFGPQNLSQNGDC